MTPETFYELCREYGQHYLNTCQPITQYHHALPLLEAWRYEQQEHLVVITLNTSNAPIKVRHITKGTLNASLAHPREIFVSAITDRAAGIIVAHNHPSGTLAPSREDIKLTERLVEAGNILGINVIDHIIISPAGSSSVRETDERLFQRR